MRTAACGTSSGSSWMASRGARGHIIGRIGHWAWLSPASRMATAARDGRIWSSRTQVFPGRPESVPDGTGTRGGTGSRACRWTRLIPAAARTRRGPAAPRRLVFEREWRIPQDTDPQRLLDDVLGFLLDALTIALSEDMPPARRELVYTASEVIRELVAA